MNGQISASQRAQCVERSRANDLERRMAYYHKQGGLAGEVYSAAREKRAVPIDLAKQFLLAGNTRSIGLFTRFETRFGPLHQPTEVGGYDVALKDCVDSRSVVLSPLDFMLNYILEERTAAVGIRSGHVFQQLRDYGRGFVMTHSSCGGENVAHQAVKGKLDGQIMDGNIQRIVETVPAGIARISDPHERAVSNAIIQARIASLLLSSYGVNRPIDPIMLYWDKEEDPHVSWLSEQNSCPHERVLDMGTVAQDGARMIKEFNGAPLSTHWAMAAFFYDATRLGRVCSPHAIFDLHQNMGFAVTANFTPDERNTFAGSAVGSLRYAVSHGGEGHVKGIGNRGGSRMVVILDPEEAVLTRVKGELCNSSKELNDLTRGGETIIRALYNITTRQVTFLD